MVLITEEILRALGVRGSVSIREQMEGRSLEPRFRLRAKPVLP